MTCKTCLWQRVKAKGECMACLQWRRRHDGQPRPVAAIRAHRRRMVAYARFGRTEAELEARKQASYQAHDAWGRPVKAPA